jgi:hypothetical protein
MCGSRGNICIRDCGIMLPVTTAQSPPPWAYLQLFRWRSAAQFGLGAASRARVAFTSPLPSLPLKRG